MRFSRDAYAFDQQFLNRFVGLPDSAKAVSSLTEWESLRQGGSQIVGDTGQIGKGRGAIGNLMEWIASMMHWFEEHLVLQGGDKGILHAIGSIGKYLVKIEDLLSQPRYLLLMSLITFIVIL
jgi:hypothetical protein